MNYYSDFVIWMVINYFLILCIFLFTILWWENLINILKFENIQMHNPWIFVALSKRSVEKILKNVPTPVLNRKNFAFIFLITDLKIYFLHLRANIVAKWEKIVINEIRLILRSYLSVRFLQIGEILVNAPAWSTAIGRRREIVSISKKKKTWKFAPNLVNMPMAKLKFFEFYKETIEV